MPSWPSPHSATVTPRSGDVPHTHLQEGRGAGGVICWGPCTTSAVEVPACQAGQKFTAEKMQEAEVKLRSQSGQVLSPALLRESPYPAITPKQAATLIAGRQHTGPSTGEPRGTTAPSAQPKGVPAGLEPDMLSPYPC